MTLVCMAKNSIIAFFLVFNVVFAAAADFAKVPKTEKMDCNSKVCRFRDKNKFSVKQQVVYHGSLVQNLKVVKPHKSSHGEYWVYATHDPAIAASFIATASDFDFAIIINEEGICSIIERYKNAFDLYKGVKGSIYQLPSHQFLASQTTWDAEFICPEKVSVLSEQIIPDVYEFLKQKESEGKIHLYYYPNRPSCIPVDDSDMVEKAVCWSKEDAPNNTKERFLKLHPHLKDQFEKADDLFEISRYE